MIKAKNIFDIPSRFLTDGEFLFDLPENWEIRKTKSAEALDQENKISQEIAYSFALPRTAKNEFALGNSKRFIEVEIYENGELLEFDQLRRLKKRDTEFEVEVFGSNWAEKLSRLKLNQLNLGEFEYTQANALNTWSDTTGLVVAAPAHYGAFNQEGSITRKDLRFWFNLTKLMRACFCAIGWEFKSPFWDGLPGDQLYGYLSGRYWYSYRDKTDPLRVLVENNGSIPFDGLVTELIFPIETFDPFNLYNGLIYPGGYLYPPGGFDGSDMIIKIRFTVYLPATPVDLPAPTWTILLYQDRPRTDEGFFPFFTQYQGIPGVDQTIEIDEEIRIEEILAGDAFTIFVEYKDRITPLGDNYPWEIRPSGSISYLPDVVRYIEDDSIYLGDLLNGEVTALDLYKAMMHLVSGYSEPEFSKKRVTMHIPFDAVIDGRFVEGFFLQSVIDLSGKVQAGSVIENEIREDIPNRGILKFADSTDVHIENQNYPKPYFSKEFTIKEGNVEDTLKLENPLFEPTIERDTTVEEIGILPDGTTVDETPALMALWDNDEGKVSKDLGARIAFHHGFVKQQKPDGEDYKFVFEGVAIPQFGYLSQWPTRRVTTSYFYRPVYGNSSSDFYTSCWRFKILREMFRKVEFDMIVWLTEQDYRDINFRRSIVVEYEGTRRLRVKTIKDFRSRLPTPIVCTEELEDQQ